MTKCRIVRKTAKDDIIDVGEGETIYDAVTRQLGKVHDKVVYVELLRDGEPVKNCEAVNDTTT